MILHDMSQKQMVMVASGGSLVLLAGAYLFQALGYAPCQMCLWQRWPHGAAIVLGLVAIAGIAPRVTAYVGAAAALTTAGLAPSIPGLSRAGGKAQARAVARVMIWAPSAGLIC